jgi:hypothetical protein
MRYLKLFTALTALITICTFPLVRTFAVAPWPALVSPILQQACTWQAYTADTPYDEVAQIACHNCYDKDYDGDAANFYEVMNKTKTVEIDFYDAKNSDQDGRKNGYWYVRHDQNGASSGNDNNCVGKGTGSSGLQACLEDVAHWHNDHPNHDVLTVILDKKQDWGDGRQPVDLDALISYVIPSDSRYRPVALQGDDASLRTAVSKKSWPKMAELSGKIILVLTGGKEDHHNETQSEYVAARGKTAELFIAPDTDEKGDVTGKPNEFNDTTAGFVVWYNIKNGISKQSEIGQLIRSKNYISRLWNGDKSPCDFASQCLNFIALKDLTTTCSGAAKWKIGP